MPAVRRGSGLRSAGRRWGAVTLTLIAANVAMFLVTAVSAVSVGSSPLDNCAVPRLRRAGPAAVPACTARRMVAGHHRSLPAHRPGAPGHEHARPAALRVGAGTPAGPRALPRASTWWRLSAGRAAIQLFGYPRVRRRRLHGDLRPARRPRRPDAGQRQDIRGLLTLLAINVFISFLPGVSLLGHLGGLVAGALAAGILVLDPPPASRCRCRRSRCSPSSCSSSP